MPADHQKSDCLIFNFLPFPGGRQGSSDDPGPTATGRARGRRGTRRRRRRGGRRDAGVDDQPVGHEQERPHVRQREEDPDPEPGRPPRRSRAEEGPREFRRERRRAGTTGHGNSGGKGNQRPDRINRSCGVTTTPCKRIPTGRTTATTSVPLDAVNRPVRAGYRSTASEWSRVTAGSIRTGPFARSRLGPYFRSPDSQPGPLARVY